MISTWDRRRDQFTEPLNMVFVAAGHRRTLSSTLSRYQLITAHRYLLWLKWAPRQRCVLWSADECSQSSEGGLLCLPSGCNLPARIYPRNFKTHRNGFMFQLTFSFALRRLARHLDCRGFFRPKLLGWRPSTTRLIPWRKQNASAYYKTNALSFVTGRSWTDPLLQAVPLSFSKADVKNIRGIY